MFDTTKRQETKLQLIGLLIFCLILNAASCRSAITLPLQQIAPQSEQSASFPQPSSTIIEASSDTKSLGVTALRTFNGWMVGLNDECSESCGHLVVPIATIGIRG